MSAARELARPRILVEAGDYQCGNLGDVSMLQTTVARLRAMWPEGSIQVVTQRPDALAAYCPGAAPVSWEGHQLWLGRGTLLGPLDAIVRRAAPRGAGGVEGALRRRSPALFTALLRARLRVRGGRVRELTAFHHALAGADAVVLCGAGGFTDHVPAWTLAVLGLLDAAARRGIRTAVFGHGLGPLGDPVLRRAVAGVLPRLDVLALREGRGGLPLLASLGVWRDDVLVTGDDAIEMAWAARPAAPGTGIGVNVRVAESAGVDEGWLDAIRPVLREAADEVGAPLVPLPIGRGRASRDAVAIRRLLEGRDDVGDIALDTPRAVIEAAGRCRIVVTGAYHAAVFALAQGIPAVCLARSAYFSDKMLGLADQFGPGCTVVELAGGDVKERLALAIRDAWRSADEVRGSLLNAAARQARASREAYARFGALVGGASPLPEPESERAPAGGGTLRAMESEREREVMP